MPSTIIHANNIHQIFAGQHQTDGIYVAATPRVTGFHLISVVCYKNEGQPWSTSRFRRGEIIMYLKSATSPKYAARFQSLFHFLPANIESTGATGLFLVDERAAQDVRVAISTIHEWTHLLGTVCEPVCRLTRQKMYDRYAQSYESLMIKISVQISEQHVVNDIAYLVVELSKRLNVSFRTNPDDSSDEEEVDEDAGDGIDMPVHSDGEEY